MTCIVGLATQGGVWIGADSAGVAGTSLTIRADRKVFRNGPMLFGFTHSFRTLQLFRWALSVPDHDPRVDTEKYLCTTFVNAARQCLKDGGHAEVDSGVERGTTCLIGYQGRLFTLMADWQVGESACGYDAVGCGADLALGAMHANYDVQAPKKRVEYALRAASAHSAGVHPPFFIEELT